MNITANEHRVLRAILTNHSNPTPAMCINDANEPSGITGASLSGVCAGLYRKGLLTGSGKGTKSDPILVQLTSAGEAAALVKITLPAPAIVAAAKAKAAETPVAVAPEGGYACDALLGVK